MHWINVAIILCIGNFWGWMVAMYAKDAVSGLLGHVVTSTIGAFIVGYLTLVFFPKYGTAVMLPAAFIGSGLVLYLVRFRKWGWQKKASKISDTP